MFRRWWNDPRMALRLTTSFIIAAGLIAGLGLFLRDVIDGLDDQWTFFLDTASLLLAVAGAVLDFRAISRMESFAPGWGRRRAAVQLFAGAIAGVGACLILGWADTEELPAMARGALSAGMFAGIGLGIAGMLYFGWFSGAERLERRIEQRTDEDW